MKLKNSFELSKRERHTLIRISKIQGSMTVNTEPKLSLIEEFKGLNPKQWIAIIASFAVCLLLVCTGMFLAMCMGFFIVAVILYMVPHMLGVRQ